jgi:hypothetical protein
MKKITAFKTLIAAAVVVTGLSACHSYANDNTSRPCVPDVNGDNPGNDQIEANRPMGNDANPRNRMWDGYTSPEERIGDSRDACCEKKEESKEHSGHEEH